MAYNADDPKQVKTARKRVEQEEALKHDVIRNIMITPHGRKWIYGWLDQCFIYGNPFVPGQPDASAFNMGMANIGKVLLADVQVAAPDLYMQMIREAKGLTTTPNSDLT